MAVQLVGGAFLSASLQVLFDRLASSEVLNFIRGQKLSDSVLSKFKIKLLIVDRVLDHAEVKQFTDGSQKVAGARKGLKKISKLLGHFYSSSDVFLYAKREPRFASAKTEREPW